MTDETRAANTGMRIALLLAHGAHMDIPLLERRAVATAVEQGRVLAGLVNVVTAETDPSLEGSS